MITRKDIDIIARVLIMNEKLLDEISLFFIYNFYSSLPYSKISKKSSIRLLIK